MAAWGVTNVPASAFQEGRSDAKLCVYLGAVGASKEELVICQVAIVLLMLQKSGVHQFSVAKVEIFSILQDFLIHPNGGFFSPDF